MIEANRAETARGRVSRNSGSGSAGSSAFLADIALLGAGLRACRPAPMSPYQFNPFNVNPLREALAAEVDFERLREAIGDQAPARRDPGARRKLRIVTKRELTVDAVLASACLPLLHHAIELDGEPYWDGGYAANPPLVSSRSRFRCGAHPHRPDHAVDVGAAAEVAARNRRPARTDPVQRHAEQRDSRRSKYGKMIGATKNCGVCESAASRAESSSRDSPTKAPRNLDWGFLERLPQSGRAAADLWLKRGLPAAAGASQNSPRSLPN